MARAKARANVVDLRSTIPEPVDTFVGRETELADLADLTHMARLVTLVGPAGVGKTRLAFEATRRVIGGRRRAVRLVELASVVDGTRIVETIATALGVCDQRGEPGLRPVVDAINDRRLSLVIDNCEQVSAPCAVVVQELLLQCPELRVLATSREPLRLQEECVVQVDPLPVDGSDSSAVRLFIDRAQAGADFQLEEADVEAVVQLCQQLDGMPLAIELAARRAHAMPVREMVRCMDRQLGDRDGARIAPDGHQNLRAAIEWSYRLLSPVEQRVLRRLAMFPGGLTLAAAERVCAVPDLGAVLPDLVTKSLVQRSGSRFRMLEAIRRYGLEQLKAAGEQGMTTLRAARWLADLAEPLCTAAQVLPATTRNFDVERDNLMTVYHLLEDHPREADTRVLLASALTWVWQSRGRRAAAGQLVRAVLEQHRLSVNAPIIMIAASWLAMSRGDSRQSLRYAVEAMTVIRGQRRPGLLVRALKQLGWALDSAGRAATSEVVRRQVVRLCERMSLPVALAQARQDLAWLLVCVEDPRQARALMEVALPVARKGSRSDELGPMLRTAGAIELRDGSLSRAKKCFVEVLDAAPLDTHNRAYALEGLAMVAEHQGDVMRAGRLFAAARTCRNRYGVSASPLWRSWVEESAARVAVPDIDDLNDEAVLNYARGVPDVVDDPVRALFASFEKRGLAITAGDDAGVRVDDQPERKTGWG